MKGLWIPVLACLVFWAIVANCFGATYSVNVDDKYVPYLEKRAAEEKMTVQGIIENAAASVGNRAIEIEYQNNITSKKNIDEKLIELKAKKPK